MKTCNETSEETYNKVFNTYLNIPRKATDTLIPANTIHKNYTIRIHL